MNNHFNFMWRNGEVLITNDFGDYAFLSKDEFTSFVSGKVQRESELFTLLSRKGFITDENPNVFINERIGDLRNIKGYLF